MNSTYAIIIVHEGGMKNLPGCCKSRTMMKAWGCWPKRNSLICFFSSFTFLGRLFSLCICLSVSVFMFFFVRVLLCCSSSGSLSLLSVPPGSWPFSIFFCSPLLCLSPSGFFLISPLVCGLLWLFYKAIWWPLFMCSCPTIMRHERLCYFEKKQGNNSPAIAGLFNVAFRR